MSALNFMKSRLKSKTEGDQLEISLVSPRAEDVNFWFEVRNQKSTRENNPIGVLSKDELKRQVLHSNSDLTEKKSVHRYYIQKADQEFVGVISLKDINWDSEVCEIGYLIAEKFHNQGFATRAVGLLIQKAFSVGIRKIKATTYVNNLASSKVLKKNGFVLEGTFRNEVLIQEKIQDMHSWAAFADRTDQRINQIAGEINE